MDHFKNWWSAHGSKLNQSAYSSTLFNSAFEALAREAWKASEENNKSRKSKKDGDWLIFLLEELLSSKEDILICHDYEDGFWLKSCPRGFGRSESMAMDRSPGRIRFTLAEAIREALRHDDQEHRRIFNQSKYPPQLLEEEKPVLCPRCQSDMHVKEPVCNVCNDVHYTLVCSNATCDNRIYLASSYNRCQRTPSSQAPTKT